MEARLNQALAKRLVDAFQSKVEIADALKVSRQTIYDWLKGKYKIHEEHKENIRGLLKAANFLMENDVRPSKRILRRLTKLSFGPVNESSARILVDQLKKEEAEAAKLSARLAGRDKKADFSDAGIPMLQE